MKKIVIPIDEKDKNYVSHYNFCTFLFQLNYEFYLIIYPHYLEGYSHLDMKEDFLKQILEIKKPIKTDNIERKYALKEIKKDILKGIVFNTIVYEICNIYKDNALKEYCYAAKHDYTKYIEFQCSYFDKYKEAERFIIEDKLLNIQQKKFCKRILNRFILVILVNWHIYPNMNS